MNRCKSKIAAQNDAITEAATGEAFQRIVAENKKRARAGLAVLMAQSEKAVSEEFKKDAPRHSNES